MTPGIYWDLPAAAYHAVPALSHSGMNSLLVSPFRYWFDYLRPEREPRVETPAMRLGTALHAAVLEPDRFLDRYNCQVTRADFTDCLETVADLKTWLDARRGSTRGNKPDLIREALRIDSEVKILDVEMERHAAANHDKILLDKVEWERVYGMSRALLREEELKPILASGRREVSIFVNDPETGVPLKCRIDWLQDDPQGGAVLDLKTFSARGGPIDDTVVRALRFDGYIRQAWLYKYILNIAGKPECTWVNAFVESEAPYETRLRSMGPDLTRTARYWGATGLQVLKLMRVYAQCSKMFGLDPWAYHQAITPVRDSELPGLAYSVTEKETADV